MDDVFTSGSTKKQAIKLLKSLATNISFVGLVVAVDRQEEKGATMEEFKKNFCNCVAIVNKTDIFDFII